MKLPCNICSEYHLTHQCLNMEEAQFLLAHQQLVMLKNLFPCGHNLQVGSSGGNMQGDTQNAPFLDGSMYIINMVNHKEEVGFSTRAHDYDNLELTSKGKKTLNP